MARVSPPPLTDAENARWYSKFFYERYPDNPEAIAELGDNSPMGLENATAVEDRFRILTKGNLPESAAGRSCRTVPRSSAARCL